MAAFDPASDALPLARQQDYDAFVKDLMDNEGMSIDEAAAEALETFSSEYNPSTLFIYRTKVEMEEKTKCEMNIKTIERASRGEDSIVNATFCFQGLRQSLAGTNAALLEGTWHMIETRGLLKTLVHMLKVTEKDEDDEKVVDKIGEDSDEDEDEDENAILLTVSILDFTNLMLQNASSASSIRYFRNMELFLSLDEENMTILKGRLDEDVGEIRVVTKILPLLTTLLAVPSNKSFFVSISGIDLLELTIKMHKKNKLIVTEIQTLITSLA